MKKDKPGPVAAAVTARLTEQEGVTAYAVAKAAGVGVDVVYGLRDGGGARIESLSEVLDALGLVIVPACEVRDPAGLAARGYRLPPSATEKPARKGGRARRPSGRSRRC